jgi:1,2-dihydroxy-3-keto-5-methylthiopentene dioxygenase
MYARAGYAAFASYFHWIVAFPLIGTVATVLKAQQAPKEEKGEWMFRHKSLGLLTGMLVAPRVAYRVLSRDSYNVQKMLGNSSTENVLGTVTHYMLYGFMIVMPASGVAMGYYGGKGLPFFTTTIPGALAANDETKKRNGQIAKQVRSFKLWNVEWSGICSFFALILSILCSSSCLQKKEFPNPQTAGCVRQVSHSCTRWSRLHALFPWPGHFCENQSI